jgi:hypothetical protein
MPTFAPSSLSETTAVREQHRDDLGQVHAAAAADAEHDVGGEAANLLDALGDRFHRKVGLRLIIDMHFDPRSFQVGEHGLELLLAAETGVGADQSPFSERGGDYADCTTLTRTEEDRAGETHGAEDVH